LKWAIKFRSYGIEIGDLLYDLFPGARCLFLYRNASDWVGSMVRAFGGEEAMTSEIVHLYWEFMKLLVRMTALYPDDEQLTLARMTGVHWLAPIDRYLQLAEQGIKMLPVRYEDLKTATVPVIEAIFAYCGVEAEDHSSLVKVLTRDSQAGSPLARELSQDKQFPNKDQVMKEIQALLSAQPVINRPDFVLPGTLVL
jgi:hypothetical protein